MRVGSVQPVGEAVIAVIGGGGRVEVLHGAEVFGGDGLEGRRPKTSLDNQDGKTRRISTREDRQI